MLEILFTGRYFDDPLKITFVGHMVTIKNKAFIIIIIYDEMFSKSTLDNVLLMASLYLK